MARTGESYAAARAQLDARSAVLHVTNGDSAATGLRQGGVEGEVLAWRDVLHEGPVQALPPAALARARGRFLADIVRSRASEVERDLRARDRVLARGAEDEVVLWFEADLYDQLQLIQVLDRLVGARVPLLTLVSVGEYPGRAHFGGLGELPVKQLVALRDSAAVDVDPGAFDLAHRSWRAFTAPDPNGLPALSREHSPVLRHLGEALERLLQEYPWTGDGLSLTERRVLRAVEEGAATKREVFEHVWRAERRPFLGDAWCDRVTDRLVGAGLLERTPALVRTGRDRLTEVDRWIGGVHLQGAPRWRWDPQAETLVTDVDM
jgi:hypothetical protein